MTNVDEMRQQLELLNDEELITIFRRHDAEQWRPEAFDIVGSILKERGVPLAGGLQEAASEEDIVREAEELNLTTVATYFNYMDAETDRLALETKGLKAWIFNENNPLAEGIAQGIQLQVRTDDLDAAMEILQSEPVPSSDLPDDIAEPPCPKCGSRQVTEGGETVGTSSGPATSWLYHCAACNHKWSAS